MIGLERAVEIFPCDVEHDFVRQSEVVEQHRPRRLAASGAHGVDVVDGQFHGREHRAVVTLGDEEGAPLACGLDRERGAVDQADAGRQGINAEAVPDQIQERRCMHHLDLHSAVGPQQLDRALGNEGRARYRIGDVPAAWCDDFGGRHQIVHDRRVDLLEALARFVVMVEAFDRDWRARSDRFDRRVALGADKEASGARHGGQSGGGDKLRTRWAEADHDHPRAAATGWPRGRGALHDAVSALRSIRRRVLIRWSTGTRR